MKSNHRALLLGGTLILALLLVAGCGFATDTAGTSPLDTPAPTEMPLTDAPAPTDTPTPTDTPASTEEDPVAAAREELAQRLGMSPDTIEVVSVEEVEWPDASLGCPQPEEAYAQVIVPGQRIVLGAGGEQYTYHSGLGNIVLCEEPATGEPPGGEEIDPMGAQLVGKARAALSERLGIEESKIAVESVEAVRWRDSSLGCPQPGMQYLQVITPGYRIRLTVGGKTYQYHTDQSQILYCENPPEGHEVEISLSERLVEKAKVSLAETAGVDVADIQVLQVQYVEWADGSLGCPKAGQMYPQVITPGYLIRLMAGGQEYEYHTSMRDVVLCRR